MAWGSGEPEPTQVRFYLLDGSERTLGFRAPRSARCGVRTILRRLNIDVDTLAFTPIGIDHAALAHAKDLCRTCTPDPTATEDEITVLECGFRSIALQDAALRQRRTAPSLARILARKRVFDLAVAARMIAAYDDELRAAEAMSNGRCRACKVNRGQHWHKGETRPARLGDRIELVQQPCPDPACTRPAREAPYCSMCGRAGDASWERQLARYRFLLRRGASVPKRYLF